MLTLSPSLRNEDWRIKAWIDFIDGSRAPHVVDDVDLPSHTNTTLIENPTPLSTRSDIARQRYRKTEPEQ